MADFDGIFDIDDFWVGIDVKDHIPEDEMIFGKDDGFYLIHVTKETGDNLLREDREEGYSWYVNFDCYSSDKESALAAMKDCSFEEIEGLTEGDGGMQLYKDDDQPTPMDMIKDALENLFSSTVSRNLESSIAFIEDCKGNMPRDIGLTR